MSSLQTLAVDVSSLWALASEALNDPWLKERAREMVRPLDDSRGQASGH